MSFDELMQSLAKFRMVTAATLAEGHGDEVIDLNTNTADAFATSLDETRSSDRFGRGGSRSAFGW